MEAKLTRSGDEFVIRIPADAAREHRLAEGQTVDVSPRRPVETLQDMIAEMDRLGPAFRPETVDWGPDVGAEIIRDEWT